MNPRTIPQVTPPRWMPPLQILLIHLNGAWTHFELLDPAGYRTNINLSDRVPRAYWYLMPEQVRQFNVVYGKAFRIENAAGALLYSRLIDGSGRVEQISIKPPLYISPKSNGSIYEVSGEIVWRERT